MKIASFQPTFLSYAGYFGLIDYVDKFVIMDNVQFAARGWQQRVLINVNNSPKYLTLPVIKKKLRSQLICDTKIDNSSDYIKKHLLTIKHSYSKFPYFDKFYPEIEKIYKKKFNKLIDLNLSLIFFICNILNIDKDKFIFLSDMKINDDAFKANLIYEICVNIEKTKEYIATEGAKMYLNNNKKLNLEYDVKYFKYLYDTENISIYNKNKYHLSIIDLIFTHGEKTKNIIESNFHIIKK